MEADKLSSIRMKIGEDDEYQSMAWGSAEDISDLIDYIDELQDKIKKLDMPPINKVWGIPIERISELIFLFKEAGYDLTDAEHFKLIKRDYFNKVEKELEDESR